MPHRNLVRSYKRSHPAVPRFFYVILGALFLLAQLLTGQAGLAHAAGKKPFIIGVLTATWGPPPTSVGLRDGLNQLGYRENVDFVIGIRFTQGKISELPQAARQLLASGADLLFTIGTPATKAAMEASKVVPIIFNSASDPVGSGLINSFSSPGGNVTGVTEVGVELAGRRLQIFHQMIPDMKKILYVSFLNSQGEKRMARLYRETAASLGLTVVVKKVKTQQEARKILFDPSFRSYDGIISPRKPDLNIMGFILIASSRHKIPTMFGDSFMLEDGRGLASYGASWRETGLQSARLVEKIMRGTHPSNIPVEANSKIELVINLKVAKRLGLKIAPEMMYRADRLIR